MKSEETVNPVIPSDPAESHVVAVEGVKIQQDSVPVTASAGKDGPPLPSGCAGRLRFMCCGKRDVPYLEQKTDHNDFTRNGVHYVQWLDVILNISGRPSYGWKLLWILAMAPVCTAIVLHDLSNTDLDKGIDKDTMGFLTFGLSLLLVFRVGQSYNRYNEARVKWGMMVNRTRDTVRQFWAYCSDANINDAATRWTVAFVYACKHSLRWNSVCDDVGDFMQPAEVREINAADHMPVLCMEKIGECVAKALRERKIDTQQAYMIDRNITSFEDQIGACERILKTPVPFGLVLHLRWLILLYCVCMPLFLADHLKWGAVPVTVIFAYTLTGLEDISQEIENPFRRKWHALPINAICKAIKSNCFEIRQRYAAAGQKQRRA